MASVLEQQREELTDIPEDYRRRTAALQKELESEKEKRIIMGRTMDQLNDKLCDVENKYKREATLFRTENMKKDEEFHSMKTSYERTISKVFLSFPTFPSSR